MPVKSTPKLSPPPKSLVDLQTWLSDAVTTPPDQQPKRLATEAKKHLTASEKLTPKERLDIYVDDFWPRALESLADDFPLLKKYLGDNAFDRWMEKYLKAYPSHSFTLFHLGQDLYKFMSKSTKDKTILETVAYEWALVAAYIAKEEPPFNPASLNDSQKARLPELVLKFHPSVTLLSKNSRIVYRKNYEVKEKDLEFPFFRLLSHMKEGKSLSQALDSLPNELSDYHVKLINKRIQRWFELCVQSSWFIHPQEEK